MLHQTTPITASTLSIITRVLNEPCFPLIRVDRMLASPNINLISPGRSYLTDTGCIWVRMHSAIPRPLDETKAARGAAHETAAFEFSIGGQGGIMRLTPCKIGPLWAACRSAGDATQLPRKRALLHAITCTRHSVHV